MSVLPDASIWLILVCFVLVPSIQACSGGAPERDRPSPGQSWDHGPCRMVSSVFEMPSGSACFTVTQPYLSVVVCVLSLGTMFLFYNENNSPPPYRKMFAFCCIFYLKHMFWFKQLMYLLTQDLLKILNDACNTMLIDVFNRVQQILTLVLNMLCIFYYYRAMFW